MAKEREQYGMGDLLRDVEVWERIARVPDDYPLAPKQAAVLMTFSERTLQSWRKNGSGPPYYQGDLRVEPNGAPPPPGTNQHVKYFKRDIAAWWERNKVSNVMQAAVLKGQTFVSTLNHLVQEAAFYVDAQGQIEGMVENDTIERLLSQPDACIEWLPVLEAAASKWSDMDAHRQLAERVQGALSEARSRVEAGLEASDIASVSREGRKAAERD